MYKQYFKQAIASLRENPLVGLLTILGTALSVAMIMVLVLVYQVRTASFSPVAERHRILYITEIAGLNEKNSGYIGNGLGYRIINECFYPMQTPEVISAATNNTRKQRLSVPGIKQVQEVDVRGVDAAFWNIFDFRFLNGAPFTQEVFDAAIPVAVISDRIALAFFGTTDVVGQTIQLDFVDYTIRGIVPSVSEAVSEAYGEIWVPYSVNHPLMNENVTEGIGGSLHLFILARSAGDFAAIRQEAQSRVITFNAGQKDYKANIWKQPVTSIQRMFYFVRGDRMHGVFSGMISLAALFLLLPILNLLGIIFSQMKKRQPEIGIRKAFGATTKRIVLQILGENLVITLLGGIIGLFFSILFFYMTKDSLLEQTNVQLHLRMVLRPALFGAALLVCLLINLLSTGIPAWRAARAEVTDSLHSTV